MSISGVEFVSVPAILLILALLGVGLQGSASAEEDLNKRIDALANGNKPPLIFHPSRREEFPVYAVATNWNEESRVNQAFRELWRHNGDQLWPELMKHIDDTRFSQVWLDDGGEGDNDRVKSNSVGALCRLIAHDDLTIPYMRSIGGYGQDGITMTFYVNMIEPKDLSDLKAWYSSRAGKPLYELQIERCQWALQEIQKAPRIEENRKAKIIRQLNDRIGKLATDKKAVVSNQWHSEDYHFIDEQQAEALRKKYEHAK